MMLLYAVAAGDADSTAATEGTPLRAHRYGEVTVFVEPRTQAPERSTHEVFAYGRLLHPLWTRFPVLPVRFGTVVSDETELEQLVAEHESAWTERLTAVAGRSECIVHLPLPSGAADSTDSTDSTDHAEQTGTDYLRRRAAEVRSHDHETAELKALLAPYASEITPLPQVRPSEARLSVLVADEVVEEVLAAVERWATSRAGATVTGPWPPFSFCQEVGA